MYYLLVGIIASIILAALAVSGVFYLGPTVLKTTVKTHVTTMITQAQQIAGANILYQADEAKSVQNIDELVEFGYLIDVPAAPVVAADDARWTLEFAENPGERSYVSIELGGNEADQATVCEIVASMVGTCEIEDGKFHFPL